MRVYKFQRIILSFEIDRVVQSDLIIYHVLLMNFIQGTNYKHHIPIITARFCVKVGVYSHEYIQRRAEGSIFSISNLDNIYPRNVLISMHALSLDSFALIILFISQNHQRVRKPLGN